MSQFSTGVVFDINGNGSGLDRELSQTVTRAKSAAAEINRIKVEVPIKINEAAFRADAQRIIAGVQAEANRMFANRGGGFPGGGMGGGGGGGAGGGSGGGGGGGSPFTAVSRTFQAVAMVESAFAGGAVVIKSMSAAADLMNGNTKEAMKKMADLGDSLQDMRGPVGAIVRITADLTDKTGELLGFWKSIGTIEGDTKNIDAKTATMAARNKAVRGVNAGFKAISEGEADRTARENAQTPSEAALVDLARERQRLQKTIADNNVKGVDKDAAQKALDALTHRETDLKAKAQAEREVLERKHQAALTEQMEKGHADRLKAEGFDEAADRAALEARQKKAREDLITELAGATKPADQRRIQERLNATKAAQVEETAAFEAELQRKVNERGKQSAEAAADFASAAGAGSLKREQQREAIAKDARKFDFEARQDDLKTTGFSDRARLEAIKQKAVEELRTAEDPKERAAIQSREAAELRALQRELAGAPNQRAEVSSDPTRTAFGRGGVGVGDNVAGLKQLDKTLRTDILLELQKITKNTKDGGTSKTS